MSKLSPASAVGSASADARTLSKGRLAAAAVCAVGGLAATTTPLFIPGAMGGATGAASALVFITAVALAGPALVLRAATWAADHRVLRASAASVLATANTRGYSRRVTAAVVPLGLLLSLGLIQTGMSSITSEAARQQLGDAIVADFVWQGPAEDGADAADSGHARETLAALPGVAAVAVSEAGVVQARIEPADEEVSFMEGLSWEPASVRSIDVGAQGGLIDPGVTSGDLAALSQPGTVAVASDSLFGSSTGVGDAVGLRYRDGSETDLKIVAIYERGMGLGGLIVGPEGFAPVASEGSAPMVLVDAVDGEQDAVAAAATAAGFTLMTAPEYVDAAMQAGGGENNLSDTLLLALLVFIGIAAGNSLLIATRSRAREFEMLARIGATRRQLRAMLGIEAAMIAVAAVAIGILTAAPGLLAASLAIVRGVGHGLDPVMFGGLVVAVVGIAFAGVAGTRLKVRV
jgi:putative ABC transport system permease protein